MAQKSKIPSDILKKIKAILAALVTVGYIDGASRIANGVGKPQIIAQMDARMLAFLKDRIDLVEASIEGFMERLEEFIDKLEALELSIDEYEAKLTEYMNGSVETTSDIIATAEYASSRFNGAGDAAKELDLQGLWYFPHLEAVDDECPICIPIREGAPYTMEEAENLGYPELPHVNCHHAFIFVLNADEGEIESTVETGIPGLAVPRHEPEYSQYKQEE